MSSGNGLDPIEVKIKNFVATDLIAGIRMEDLILFVSLREMLEGKTALSETSFVYPKGRSTLDSETSNTLTSKNPLVSVSGLIDKKIVLKKKLQDLFGLIYIPEVESKKIRLDAGKPLSVIMQELSEACFSKDTKFKSLQTNMEKANVYLIRSVLQKNNNVNQFSKNFGYLHYEDFKKFVEKSKIVSKLEEKIYLKNTSLPRLSNTDFFTSLLQEKGNLNTGSGFICWTIDDRLDLYSNVEFSEDRRITKNNFEGFEDATFNREMCSSEGIKEEDKIIGYFDKGVYKKITSEELEKQKSEQEDYYTLNIKKLKGEGLTSFLKLKYRKFFKYPRVSFNIFVSREDSSSTFFDKTLESTGSKYVFGFYETLNPRPSPGTKDALTQIKFQNTLKIELLNYIMRRFVNRDRLTIRSPKKNNEVRKILVEMEKDIKLGRPRQIPGRKGQYYVTREDYVTIIEILTGVKEIKEEFEDKEGNKKKIISFSSMVSEGNALKTFLKDPNIFYGTQDGVEYPNLRLISYFVLCSDNENCTEIYPVGNDLTSMDILRKPRESGFKMYFNESSQRFINTGL